MLEEEVLFVELVSQIYPIEEIPEEIHLPRNVLCPVTIPFLSANICLYHSYEVKRIAIFGTMPVRTAPRPL